MKKFLIIIEKYKGAYSAHSPDLPGCVATGRTKATVQRRMRTAIQMHLDGLRQDGLRIPPQTTWADYVEVEG